MKKINLTIIIFLLGIGGLYAQWEGTSGTISPNNNLPSFSPLFINPEQMTTASAGVQIDLDVDGGNIFLDNDRAIVFGRFQNGGGEYIINSVSQMSPSHGLSFFAGYRERMTILNNGNVGIGIVAPTSQLHTTGSVRFEGITQNNTLNRVMVQDPNGNVFWRDDSTFGGNICNALDTCDWKTNGNLGVQPWNFIGPINNEGFRIRTDNTERAEYTNDGNYKFGTGNTIGMLGNRHCGIMGSSSTITDSHKAFALGGNNIIKDSDQSGVFGEDLQMYNSHGSFIGGAHSVISNAWSNGPIDDYNASIGHGNNITGNSAQAIAFLNGNFGTSNKITGASTSAHNNVNLGDANTITDGTYNSNRGISNTNSRSNYSHTLGFRNNIQSTENSQTIGDYNTINASHSNTIRGFENTMEEDRLSHILGNGNDIVASVESFAIGNNNSIAGVSNAFAIGSRISTNVNDAMKFGFNGNRTQTITERGVEIQMDPGNSTYVPGHNLEVMAGSSSGTVAEIEFRDLPLTTQSFDNVVIDPSSDLLYRKAGGSGTGNVMSSCTTQYYVPRVATGGSTDLICSQIYDNGVGVGIGSTGPFNYTLGSPLPPFIGGTVPSSGTLRLDVNGIARFTGLFATSDKRLKTNISSISNANALITQLQGKTYNWTEEYANEANLDNGMHYGFIAQEVEEVMPDAVLKDENGRYGVEYNAFIPVLVESQKELIRENEYLKSEINDLKSDIASLRDLIMKGEGYDTSPKAKLYQNFPNPSAQQTVIKYFVPECSGACEVVIHSLQGVEVYKHRIAEKGEGEFVLDVSSLTPNQYYVYTLIENDKIVDSKKMLIVARD